MNQIEWHEQQTGGGCTALEHVANNRIVYWITDECSAPEDDYSGPVTLGVYPNEEHDDFGVWVDVSSKQRAFDIVRVLEWIAHNNGAALYWQIAPELVSALEEAEQKNIIARHHDSPDIIVHPFATHDGEGAWHLNPTEYVNNALGNRSR